MKYDDWLANEPQEVPTGEFCLYCTEHIYYGDRLMRSSNGVIHKDCFDDYIHDVLEFKEEVAD